MASTAQSLSFNLGEEWGGNPYEAYRGELDPARIAFCQLLDEFF